MNGTTKTIYNRTGKHEHSTSIQTGQFTSEGRQCRGKTYCSHCGNCLVSEPNIRCQDCESVHFQRCTSAVRLFKDYGAHYTNVLSMGLHVSYLYGCEGENKKEKKNKRTLKIQELLDKVSALLNNDSGHLIIHLVGLNPGDTFTGAFDEFADVKLQSLVNDGRLFADVYKKQRLCTDPNKHLTDYRDILVLTVLRSKRLVTSDFKTKYATDDSILDIGDSALRLFFENGRNFEENHPVIDLQDFTLIHENRNVQLKTVFQPEISDDKLVNAIVDDQKLPVYVSAFTKNKQGGSVLAGVSEINKSVDGYLSKVSSVQPIVVSDTETVSKHIVKAIIDTCLVCDYKGKVKQTADLVKIEFVPQNRSTNEFVIHVSVRPVSGVVFYDKLGPVAYTTKQLDNKTHCTERLSFEEWFKAFI